MSYGTLPPGGYPGQSKLLHWLVAISVLLIAPVAIAMGRVQPGPLQDGLFNFHKSLGVLILILMVLRVANRLIVGAPAPEPGIAAWQRYASSFVHTALYTLLVIQPVIGYAGNSAFGAPTPFFGLFNLPPLVAQNQALADRLFSAHRIIGFTIVALAVVHIGAALMHHFVLRDGVLPRMLPRSMGGS